MKKLALIAAIVLATLLPFQPTSAIPPNVVHRPDAQALALSVGGSHACAVYDDGDVRCWGANGLGQLGDGTRNERPTVIERNTPMSVKNLNGFARGVVAGEGHTCALLNTGAVKCWGDNRKYQLGNGYQPPQPKPQSHETLTANVNQIAAGDNHNCAVMKDGAVRCWGSNNLEQLGISAETPATAQAIFVSDLGTGIGKVPAQLVAASTNGACALTLIGSVMCWGDDNPIPRKIAGLTDGVTAITAGGGHYCAIQRNAAKCWGSNDNGELGDGSTTRATIPISVLGLDSDVIDIEAGIAHTCALLASGKVKCWGANESGQLGDGSTTRRLIPVDVLELPLNVTAIAAGKTLTCAIMAGAVKCWGNLSYQASAFQVKPAPVQGLNGFDLGGGVAALSLGELHSCLLSYAGAAYCWGSNVQGQLGDGSFTSRAIPQAVKLNTAVRYLSAGGGHTCAILLNGTVRCWGKNDNGQVGVPNQVDQPFPLSVGGLSTDNVSVSAGWSHTCALLLGGGVKCWGANGSGQLGNGGNTDTTAAVNVLGLSTEVRAISSGGAHTCALLTNGNVRCWGNNNSGQLGVGDNIARNTPTLVTGLSATAVAIEAGAHHTCVLLNTGDVQCWGGNGDGQLGDGSTTSRVSPVRVNLSTRATAIAAGGFVGCDEASTKCGSHTCAILDGGQVMCWGRNVNGQLGNNTLQNAAFPQVVAAVPNISINAFAIDTGGGHTCMLTTTSAQSANSAYCWGSDRDSQLGASTVIQTSVGGVFWQSIRMPFLAK